MLAERLKKVIPLLIGETQTSFIEGRQNIDEISIANELIHNVKQQKSQAMILKINFEKNFWLC